MNKTHIYYDPDKDCIEFLINSFGDRFYKKRIDDHITFYCSCSTNEVVGGTVNYVTRLLNMDKMKRHLNRASIKVSSWPKWKQNVLGGNSWNNGGIEIREEGDSVFENNYVISPDGKIIELPNHPNSEPSETELFREHIKNSDFDKDRLEEWERQHLSQYLGKEKKEQKENIKIKSQKSALELLKLQKIKNQCDSKIRNIRNTRIIKKHVPSILESLIKEFPELKGYIYTGCISGRHYLEDQKINFLEEIIKREKLENIKANNIQDLYDEISKVLKDRYPYED